MGKKRKANKNHAAPVRNSAKGMKFCIINLVSFQSTSDAMYRPYFLGQDDWVLANFQSQTMKRVGYKHFFEFGFSF